MVVQVRKIYSLGEFTLDPDKKLLTCEGATVHLANRPFQVLLHLIENRDRMVSRTELLDLFWDGKDVYENTLTKCVGAIRKALNDTLEQPRFIETQWAKGYRFVGVLGESDSQRQNTSSFEIEKTRGYRVIVEEEYLEILPDSEITTPGQLPDEKTVSLHLPDKQTISATSVIKAAHAKFSLRTVALAVALIAVLLLSVGWLVLDNRLNAAEARSNVFKATSSPVSSIAVLPLKNLSDDAANEYFSDGLTETFITELSRIDSLKVISRNSVFAFKGKELDPREVGRQLGVSAVLEGSVRKNGDTVRVDVRLVSTKDGSVIWTADTYNRALKDILAVQDEIACSVAIGLRVRFCGEASTAKRYTTNVDAYQAYLKGRYYWNKRTPEGIKRSVEHFERAIAADPNYALAYAGLADSYIQGIWHVPFDSREVLPKAKAAVLQAIKLDEQLAEAHTALANVYQMEWQWAEAGKEIDRAIALNPGLARAYHVQAFQLDIMGRHDQALASIKQAQSLDPLNLVISADMAFILWRAGHTEEALAQALKVTEIDPGFAFGHKKLYEFYTGQGREKEAAEEYLKFLELEGKSNVMIAAYRKAYEKKGPQGIYQKELQELLQNQAPGSYGFPVHIAELYTLLGQKELAIQYLEMAYRQRNAEIMVIKNYTLFNPLRPDPRFQDLLRRIGLPD
jgi:TolB-like protein/DNA-binding winged helix-turn-helix (wHTH) protein